MKFKKILKSPWVQGVTFTLLAFFLTIIRDKNSQIPVLSTLQAIVALLLKTLTIDLKLWWVLCFIVFVIILRKILLSIIEKEETPSFTKYTNDHFKNLEWKWSWSLNSFNQWQIIDLSPICPDCNTSLQSVISGRYGYNYECPRCDFERMKTYQIEGKVKAIIQDNIDKGDYNIH